MEKVGGWKHGKRQRMEEFAVRLHLLKVSEPTSRPNGELNKSNSRLANEDQGNPGGLSPTQTTTYNQGMLRAGESLLRGKASN